MIDELKKNFTLVKILIILLIIATAGFILSFTWNVLSKFIDLFVLLLSAWLLSFVLDPIVERLRKLKISKLIATIVTYLLFFAALTVISMIYIPLVSSQISSILETLPTYLKTSPPVISNLIRSLTEQINNSLNFIPSFAQFLLSTFIALILSFYFIVDREKINTEFFNLMPTDWHNFLRFTQKAINDIFISFLRVQLFYAVTTGIFTWILLRVFNIEYAASIATLAGVFAFIPLIGPFLSIIPPFLVSFIADPAKALIIGAVLLVLQQITFNVIGPRLLGKAFKLHPAVIIISFLVGLQFAGTLGALLAIPVLGVSAIMIRRFGHYFHDIKNEAIESIIE